MRAAFLGAPRSLRKCPRALEQTRGYLAFRVSIHLKETEEELRITAFLELLFWGRGRGGKSLPLFSGELSVLFLTCICPYKSQLLFAPTKHPREFGYGTVFCRSWDDAALTTARHRGPKQQHRGPGFCVQRQVTPQNVSIESKPSWAPQGQS